MRGHRQRALLEAVQHCSLAGGRAALFPFLQDMRRRT